MSGNHGKNWVSSMLTPNLWLFLMTMKHIWLSGCHKEVTSNLKTKRIKMYFSAISILWVHINATKVIPKKLLVKSSENGFILVPAFYLIMCLMKAPKNFEKIAILKIWELVSLGGGKTHFGKLALKWCIFRHEEIFF